MSLDRDVSVLIVGGGPTGLTTALWLQQCGIEPVLVERRDFSQHFPRAHLLNVRTMEIFHSLGVADDIYKIAAPPGGWQRVAWYTSLAGPTPLHGVKIGDIPAWGGGNDAAHYETASPRRFANLPQIKLDHLLATTARQRLPGHVHARHELVGLRTDDDGATAEILDAATGQRREVRARYVVAADGGRTSAGLLGVSMHGPRSLIDVVSLYVRMDLREFADDTALLTYFVNPDSKASVPGALLSLEPNPLARDSAEWTISIKYRLDDPASQDVDAAVADARRLLGLPDIPIEVKAVGHWQYEGVVADRFRVGSVFIAGDAAHRHPPTGGLGLNTGVQDAANLAWKLAAVLKGEADRSLLDTYEQERLPVAAFNVEHALRNAGRHAPIGEAMGFHPDQSAEEGWQQVSIWAGDTAAGRERRAAVAAAVAHNVEDYSQLNVEAGFSYDSGAIVDDGSEPGPTLDSPTEFKPTARPGYHLPHAWLSDGEHDVSTVDLVSFTGLTLFVTESGAGAWSSAVAALRQGSGSPVTTVVLGESTGTRDPGGAYRRAAGIEADGALLVRPDKHVAWRSASLPADPAAALAEAVTAVLAGRSRPAPDGRADRLSTITNAGEALRSGHGRGSRTFDDSAV